MSFRKKWMNMRISKNQSIAHWHLSQYEKISRWDFFGKNSTCSYFTRYCGNGGRFYSRYTRWSFFFDCNNEKNIETIKIGQKKPKILQKITWPGGGGFYPRDALHSAVFAVVRRLSVCLSACHRVTLVDCIRMAEHIVKLLVRPGSPSL